MLGGSLVEEEEQGRITTESIKDLPFRHLLPESSDNNITIVSWCRVHGVKYKL